MSKSLFEEFKEYAKAMSGYDIVNVPTEKAVTFEELFGSFYQDNSSYFFFENVTEKNTFYYSNESEQINYRNEMDYYNNETANEYYFAA